MKHVATMKEFSKQYTIQQLKTHAFQIKFNYEGSGYTLTKQFYEGQYTANFLQSYEKNLSGIFVRSKMNNNISDNSFSTVTMHNHTDLEPGKDALSIQLHLARGFISIFPFPN